MGSQNYELISITKFGKSPKNFYNVLNVSAIKIVLIKQLINLQMHL